MSNKEKTLINMSKKEEIARFMAALQKAKQNIDGAKAYTRLNPVCSKCEKGGDICLTLQDGIRCARCRAMKQGCPRVVDFWKADIARRLGRSEIYVEGLYSIHGVNKRPGAMRSSSPSRASGSKNSGLKRPVETRQEVDELEEDEEGLEVEEEDNFGSEKEEAPPRMKEPAQGSHRPGPGVMHKSVVESQRKEKELLKQRAEMAESNFIALVRRVQDFRTSLRSEIHTIPDEVDSDGLLKLSSAMETAIDDAGLYLRNISDTLKQSRTNWGINYETKPEGSKAKDGGFKGPRASTSARQGHQRSPELPDGNMQKRRKI